MIPSFDFSTYGVGDMWLSENERPPGLDREVWVIHLPDDPAGGSKWPNLWTTATGYPDQMWNVTGAAPNITVTPSIFCSPPTGWHGFITNGELVNA